MMPLKKAFKSVNFWADWYFYLKQKPAIGAAASYRVARKTRTHATDGSVACVLPEKPYF